MVALIPSSPLRTVKPGTIKQHVTTSGRSPLSGAPKTYQRIANLERNLGAEADLRKAAERRARELEAKVQRLQAQLQQVKDERDDLSIKLAVDADKKTTPLHTTLKPTAAPKLQHPSLAGHTCHEARSRQKPCACRDAPTGPRPCWAPCHISVTIPASAPCTGRPRPT
jgi:hypothetical protein